MASEPGNRNRVELEIAEVANDRGRRLSGSGAVSFGPRGKIVPAGLVETRCDQGQAPSLANADLCSHCAMLSVNRGARCDG